MFAGRSVLDAGAGAGRHSARAAALGARDALMLSSVLRRVWWVYRLVLAALTVPVVLQRLFAADRVRPRPTGAFALTFLALRMLRTTLSVPTASLAVEHLTMTSHLLAVADGVAGGVVECGTFKGGSAANLSLACALVDRDLYIYDSFAGLPPPSDADREHRLIGGAESHTYEEGMYAGTLDDVKANVARHGDISRCHFCPGFYEQSMASFTTPCVMAFVDVDLRASLEACVRAIWPQLADGGSLFVHEAAHLDIASLFFDETWWRDELACDAPGLVGAGSGLGLFPTDGMWTSSIGYAVKEASSAKTVTQGLSRAGLRRVTPP